MNGLAIGATSRAVADGRDLELLAACLWLEQRFRDRREWPADELFDAATADGIYRDVLFSDEVLSLPIRRTRTHAEAAGDAAWTWIAATHWPEGHTRPRPISGRKPRKTGADVLAVAEMARAAGMPWREFRQRHNPQRHLDAGQMATLKTQFGAKK